MKPSVERPYTEERSMTHSDRLVVRFELKVSTESTIDEIAYEIERVMPWGAVGALISVWVRPDGLESSVERGRLAFRRGPDWENFKHTLDRALEIQRIHRKPEASHD